jgi:hypothetical protein
MPQGTVDAALSPEPDGPPTPFLPSIERLSVAASVWWGRFDVPSIAATQLHPRSSESCPHGARPQTQLLGDGQGRHAALVEPDRVLQLVGMKDGVALRDGLTPHVRDHRRAVDNELLSQCGDGVAGQARFNELN